MELWTIQHGKTLIPAIVLMIGLGAILRCAIGKKDRNIRMIPIKAIAVLLVALEIGKQVVSLARGYDLYHLPFHFCSLYIFTVPIMAFYRGKYKEAVAHVCLAISASLFLIMLIYPALIYSAWNIENFFGEYLSFHTVAFHNLVMLAFVLMIALDIPAPGQKMALKPVFLFILGFCVVAASMSYILKTNYASFYTCNVPPLEELRISLQSTLGVVPTQVLYVIIVALVTELFVMLSYWLCRLVQKAITEIPTRKQKTEA